MALYHSSIEWFEIRFRKPIPKGLPSSYKQYQILTDLFVAHPDETVGGYTLIDRGGIRKVADLLWSARWLNGVDLYLKWRPLVNQRGFPYVAWHTEWLTRDYATPDGTLKDSGGFTQVLWGFTPQWVAGLRLEYADGTGDDGTDSLRDQRKRYAPNLTFYPTEFSKVRLQYNRDWAEHLPGNTADSVWLQYEFNLGAHTAHKF